MSDIAFGRAAVRERTIWPLFLYSAPFSVLQTEERAVIFGLYANSYRNQSNYLLDIEASELSNLLAAYNMKISGLTTDEQIAISKIVVERYLASLDKAINDNKLLTMRDKIDSETADMDARQAALQADRGALTTLIAKIETERTQIAARILVLQAEATEEEARGTLVDVEISEKTVALSNVALRRAENDLQIEGVSLEIAKIQLRVIETGIEFTEVEVREGELKEKSVRIDNEATRAGLTAIDLTLEQAQTDVISKEVTIAEKGEETATAKRAAVDSAKVANVAAKADLITNIAAKSLAIASRQEAIIDSLDAKKDANELQNEWRVDLADLEKDGVAADGAVRDKVTEAHLYAGSVSRGVGSLDHEAAVAVANKLALAKVVKTTLTHTIGKAA